MRIFIRPVLLILQFLPFLLSAQNDSTKSINPPSITKYFNQNQFEYPDSTFSIDNSLDDFHKYNSKNTLGNIGLPFHDIEYKPFSSFAPGFNFYKNSFSPYFFSPANLKFFNTRTPYTDLFCVFGTKKEQFFRMTFSYNLKKNWNITANYFRIHSDGTYLRQNTSDNSLALSTNYKSNNNRYWLLAAIIYNNYKNAESGGIANDSVFDTGGSIDTRLLNVNLESARKGTGNGTVFLKQILNFGHRSQSADTAMKDKIIPSSRLILTSAIEGNYMKYEDDNPQSGFYPTIYNDSTKTFDSTFFYKIENELSWKRTDNLKHRGVMDMLGLGISIRHQFVDFWQKGIDTVFNNLGGGLQLYNTYSKNSFWWRFSGNYIANGYNKNDYSALAVFTKGSKDSLNSFSLCFKSALTRPDFIYNFYSSNHFSWKNDFDKTQVNAAEISFSMKKYKFYAKASYSAYTNVLYFDNYAIPRIYKGLVPVFNISVKKDFTLLSWHLNNQVVYQNVPDSSVIHVPEFILDHSLYYEHALFKKALLLQVGASVYYTSAYYADAYMPATSQFYLQDEKKYGNYPFIDFFINGQIKTVRIFFKVDHLNSGLTGNNYLQTPGYPYAGRTFKFGISWKFFD